MPKGPKDWCKRRTIYVDLGKDNNPAVYRASEPDTVVAKITDCSICRKHAFCRQTESHGLRVPICLSCLETIGRINA